MYKKLYPLNEETGYIKAIREDGKIDVTLQPEGFENIDSFRQEILDALDDHGVFSIFLINLLLKRLRTNFR